MKNRRKDILCNLFRKRASIARREHDLKTTKYYNNKFDSVYRKKSRKEP